MQNSVQVKNIETLSRKLFDIKFDLTNSDYEPLEVIGSGAYGVVCSALHRPSGKKFAIKKIPNIFQQPVIAKRTFREIKILKHFKHDNIIAIKEILQPKEGWDLFEDIYIVLDLMESDLHRIIHSKQELTEEHVRYFSYQLLRGLKYIHSACVVHRDLKPSNLLINENCDLKIGDFGMARGLSSEVDDYNMAMTQYVATRWYRAPELLMGHLSYSVSIDMWSVGCILAEMIRRKPLFPAKDYMSHLQLIVGIVGLPSEEFMSKIGAERVKNYLKDMPPNVPGQVMLESVIGSCSLPVLDLLRQLLVVDPDRRLSAVEALQHPFLTKYHSPTEEPVCIPVFNFDFEKATFAHQYQQQQMRDAIIAEIRSYHSQRPILSTLKFSFTPVPVEELQKLTDKTLKKPRQQLLDTGIAAFVSTPAHHSPLVTKLPVIPTVTAVGAPLIATVAAAATFSQPVNLAVPLQRTLDTSSDNPVDLRTHSRGGSSSSAPSSAELSIAMVSAGSATGEVTHVMRNVAVSDGRDVRYSAADDRDVWHFATDDNSVRYPAADARSFAAANRGVSYPSAGEECAKTITLANTTTVTATGQSVVPDTKSIVKAAILVRRQQHGDQPTERPRPVTAYQRQKEREDARLRRKKAREKSKKRKVKSQEDNLLTDADRQMLERWKSMQSTKDMLSYAETTAIAPASHNTQKSGSTADTASTHDTLPVASLPSPPQPDTATSDRSSSSSVVDGSSHQSVTSQQTNQAESYDFFANSTASHIQVHTNWPGAAVAVLPSVTDQWNSNLQSLNVSAKRASSNYHLQSNGLFFAPLQQLHSQQGLAMSANYTYNTGGNQFMTNDSSGSTHIPGNANASFEGQKTKRYPNRIHQQFPTFTSGCNSVMLTATAAGSQSCGVRWGWRDDYGSGEGVGLVLAQPLKHYAYCDPAIYSLSMDSVAPPASLSTSSNPRLRPNYDNMSYVSQERVASMFATNVPTVADISNTLAVQQPLIANRELPSYHAAISNRPELRQEAMSSDSRAQMSTLGGEPLLYQQQTTATHAAPQQHQQRSPVNNLTVLTRHFDKTHVDNLTLHETPKGTGGGYGVGVDLDACITDIPMERSADAVRLSATLVSDWLHVADNSTADLNALQQEVQMMSPVFFW